MDIDTLVQKDDKGQDSSQDEPRESEAMLSTSFIQRHLEEEEAVQNTNHFAGAIYSWPEAHTTDCMLENKHMLHFSDDIAFSG